MSKKNPCAECPWSPGAERLYDANAAAHVGDMLRTGFTPFCHATGDILSGGVAAQPCRGPATFGGAIPQRGLA